MKRIYLIYNNLNDRYIANNNYIITWTSFSDGKIFENKKEAEAYRDRLFKTNKNLGIIEIQINEPMH